MSKVEETVDNNVFKKILPKNKKHKSTFMKMTNLRIIRKQLVYVIGLSANIAFREDLSSYEFFGQYGSIIKLVVNKNKVYNANGPNGPSYSAYITYSTPEESSIAILSLDNSYVDNHLLRASYGTTKYCSNFLKSIECSNKECLYLHNKAEECDILDRDDMNTNKSIFLSQHVIAIEISKINNLDIRERILSNSNNFTYLPTPASIYDKDIVQKNKKFDFVQKNSFFFKTSKHSRFGFVNEKLNSSQSTNDNDSIEVPDFITKIVNKKFSRFPLFKILDDQYIDPIIIKKYDENDPWAKFIISLHEKEHFISLTKFNTA